MYVCKHVLLFSLFNITVTTILGFNSHILFSQSSSQFTFKILQFKPSLYSHNKVLKRKESCNTRNRDINVFIPPVTGGFLF